MPFITRDRREVIDQCSLAGIENNAGEFPLHSRTIQPGDRCYFYYKPMVDRWKANPRWTTAHEIYKEMLEKRGQVFIYPSDADNFIAYELAWQVFFIKYVWPYEQKKIEENGDI